MTIHECLRFIQGLHDYVAKSVDHPGPWCWPTRELLAANVRLNREHFTPDDMRNQMGRARARGWLVEAPCQSHCHARHVSLTGVGLAALALMDERGCGAEAHGRECFREGLKFERKVAA